MRLRLPPLAATCLLGVLLARPSAAAIEGYVWPLSVAPGDTISVMVSSPTAWQLRFARYHRNGDQNASDFVTSAFDEPALVQVAPDSAWAGCFWQANTTFVIPADWTPGIYGAECSASGTSTHRISFVVRPAASAVAAEFAMLANTNTWNAYNDYGGRSKYTTPAAHYCSFLRPNVGARPTSGSSANHLTRAELWVHDFLATSGYHVDTWSDWDLHRGALDLRRYKALILDTHPEYWTTEMFDDLEDYLAHGGCVMYIAGNGVYEKVRFNARGDSLECFTEGYTGGAAGRKPSYYRNLVPPRPERAVLGVAYRSDAFQTYAPFQVLMASHRFFAGTGLANGDTVGSGGLNGAASGWEMDTSQPGLAPDGVIVSCSGTDDRGIAPANLELLARGTNTASYGGDMTWYATPSGGGVFSAGSLTFGGSLVVNAKLQQIVRNVLDEFRTHAVTAVAPAPVPPRALTAGAPNPFASRTRFAFALERAGAVRVRVFDVAGRRVRTLLDAVSSPAGEGAVTWDGRDDGGRDVPDGVYLVRFETPGRAESRRVLRLR